MNYLHENDFEIIFSALEMYTSPMPEGILISEDIVEASSAKRAKAEAIRAHIHDVLNQKQGSFSLSEEDMNFVIDAIQFLISKFRDAIRRERKPKRIKTLQHDVRMFTVCMSRLTGSTFVPGEPSDDSHSGKIAVY